MPHNPDQTRLRIVQAGAELFYGQSIAEVGVDAIAERAGNSLSSDTCRNLREIFTTCRDRGTNCIGMRKLAIETVGTFPRVK